MKRKNQTTNDSDSVIVRIRKAIKAGVKIKAISDSVEGMSYFRMASVINTKAYRQSTTFTVEEANTINGVLDAIKEAL